VPPPVPAPSDPAAAFGTALGTAIGNAVGSAVGAVVGAAGAVQAAAPTHRRERLEDRAALDAPSAADAPAASDTPAPADAPVPDDTAVALDTAGPSAPGADASAAYDPHPQGTYTTTARRETFHFTFVPDFSSGLFSGTSDHLVGINLLIGSSYSSRAAEVGGLANMESGDVKGFQGAGLANLVLGNVNGYQGAGLFNYTRGESTVQTAGLANISGGSRGVQVAGLGNLSLGPFRGAQVAGLFNIAREGGHGAQVAGVFNWVQDGITGAQVAGTFNWGRSVSGPQISILNIADTVTGAQVGVINIARYVSGAQVGLINISQDVDGVPIGLFSISARGRHSIDMWYAADGSTNASLSLGTNRFYTLFNAGWTPGTDPAVVSFGLGIGGRSDIKPFFLDYDLSFMAEQQGVTKWDAQSSALYPRVRMAIGLPLFGGFAVEVGVAMKILVPYLSTSIPGAEPTTAVFKPSFFLGVHI
jgi:hypothetical protein